MLSKLMPRHLTPRWRLILVMAASLLFPGCYCNSGITSSQVGIKTDGGKIVEIVGPGVYTDSGWFVSLEQIDISAKTIEWKDDALVTSDKQPIGVNIVATYARMADPAKSQQECAKTLWSRFNAEAKDDKALSTQVLAHLPSAAKTVTASNTLDELIGTAPGDKDGRPAVTKALFDQLTPELARFCIELISVNFSNFQPDDAYLNLLKEKAQVGLKKDIATEQTKQLEQQLLQEQAQTKVSVEQADRANQVAAKAAQVYVTSPEAYQLKRLELLGTVLGDKSKVYFVPEGTDLTLFLGGEGNDLPATAAKAAVGPSAPTTPAAAKPQATPAGR